MPRRRPKSATARRPPIVSPISRAPHPILPSHHSKYQLPVSELVSGPLADPCLRARPSGMPEASPQRVRRQPALLVATRQLAGIAFRAIVALRRHQDAQKSAGRTISGGRLHSVRQRRALRGRPRGVAGSGRERDDCGATRQCPVHLHTCDRLRLSVVQQRVTRLRRHDQPLRRQRWLSD